MANRLTIHEDISLPAGSVVIGVADADVTMPLRLAFARRNADRPFLGPHGWQPSEYAFEPALVRPAAGGGAELVFASEVTRHIPVDTQVTLTVPALGIVEKHFWPGISAAPESGNLNLPDTSRVMPAPPGKYVKEPVLHEAPAEPPVQGIGTAPQMPEPVAAETRGRSRLPLFAALAMLLLLFAGAGGYFYFTANDAVTPVAAIQPPAPVAVAAAPAGPDFANRYRAFLAQRGQADAILALGEEALRANVVEIGFNAVTLAADRGQSRAKLMLGQWYDPLSETRGPVRVNPNSAALYYAEAASLGLAQAGETLQKLCAAASASPRPNWSEGFDLSTHCP